MSYLLTVYIYGTDLLKINKLALDYTDPFYNVIKVELGNEATGAATSSPPVAALSYIFKNKVVGGRAVFINADTMKPVRIRGMTSLIDIISTTESFLTPVGKYAILLNRYMDSNLQTRYIGEYNSTSNVSIFQSFNPQGSDAYYLPETTISHLRSKYSTNLEKDLYNDIKEGKISAYSYNPNLFVYTLENVTDSIKDQFQKSSIVDSTTILEDRRIEHRIGLYLSDHIVLFWIFIVFLICIVCIALLKVFRVKI